MSVTIPHPSIISVESATPRVRVWGRPSLVVGRVRKKVTFLLRLLLRVRHFCPLRSQEPLFQHRRTLLCSHQSSRCRCRSCCPRHLQQENHTNLNYRHTWLLKRHYAHFFYFKIIISKLLLQFIDLWQREWHPSQWHSARGYPHIYPR